MRFLKLLVPAAIAIATLAAVPAMANVLVNPGFEADAVLNAAPVPGATGWIIPGFNGFTASANNDPTASGIGSLQLTSTGGGFSVPVAHQTFPASPGDIWNLEGYMLTENALPANATFGLLKIVFQNALGADLIPASASIGIINNAFPGIESVPFLNSASPVNSWVFTQAQGVAPAGTAQVRMFAILVDESASTAYFDDLSANLVPEPAGCALVLIALSCVAGLVRRRR